MSLINIGDEVTITECKRGTTEHTNKKGVVTSLPTDYDRYYIVQLPSGVYCYARRVIKKNLSMSTELDAYKKKVYEEARKIQKENSWCEDGFKDSMKRLDIKIPEIKFKVGTVLRKNTILNINGHTHVIRLDNKWINNTGEECGSQGDSRWDTLLKRGEWVLESGGLVD